MRTCKEPNCSEIIETKLNSNGKATNNRQVYCDKHFVGAGSPNKLYKKEAEKVRICIVKDCDNAIEKKLNENGRVMNNQQTHCDLHKVGAKENADNVVNSYSQALQASKKKDLPFNITIPYLRSIYPKNNKCPIFDVEMKDKFAASLDKLVPELGYVQGNVWFISNKANTMKNDASLEMLVKFSEYWINKKAP